jgi:hypothetical protein
MNNSESSQFSRSPEKNSLGYVRIDRKAPEIMRALATAPIFRKQGQVQARHTEGNEKVVTILVSSTEETRNTANSDDWAVTNPSGEQYILSDALFQKRYEATDRDGVYDAKGCCRAIKNPFGKPIEILAFWGEVQVGDENCLIVEMCDENGTILDGEPYLIDGLSFTETYKLV